MGTVYFKLEYFRIIHYFYFFLSVLDVIIAFVGWGNFRKISIAVSVIGLVNLYFSYISELKIRELFVGSKTYWVLSHLLIVILTVAYYFISISKIPFPVFLQTMFLITCYISIFSSLILIFIRFDFTRKMLLFFSLSKQHLGVEKIIVLEEEKTPLFREIFAAVDMDVLKSYVIGTSDKIDNLLDEIEDAKTTGNCLWKIKFLFIYLYERKLENSGSSSEKERIANTIAYIKKQLN